MPTRRKATRRRFNPDQRAALVTEIIQRHRAGGGTLEKIAKALGTSASNYHAWVKRGLLVQPEKPAPSPAPRIYSAAERQVRLAEVDAHRAQGCTQEEACRRAGISEKSNRNWRKECVFPDMRPVEVTSLVPLPTEQVPAEGGLSLATPGGYRVEGLGVESAAALLKALAC